MHVFADKGYHLCTPVHGPVPVNRLIAAVLGLAVASPLIAVALDAAGVGPGFHVEAPEWSAGHTWSYDATLTARAQGQVFGIAGGETPTMRAELTRGFEVINTTLAEGGTPLMAALQTATLNRVLLGDEVLYDRENPEGTDAQDAAGRPGLGGMEAEFVCLDRCHTGVLLVTEELNPFLSAEPFSGDRSGPEVVQMFDFPLQRDKAWDIVKFEDDNVLVHIAATAVEEEYLNLDGQDPLRTIRIEAGLTSASRESIERQFEQAAMEEEFGADLDLDVSFTYWYAPDIEQVAKFVGESFIAGRGAGYGAAGMFRVDVKLVEELSDHDLAVKPERDVDAAERLADAARASGSGEQLSPTPLDFDVLASSRHVDAAANTPLTLQIVAPGGTDPVALPEGATIEWAHERPTERGASVTTKVHGDTRPTFTVETPGVHTFHARVLDANGQLMGADGESVEGYTRIVHELAGPAALSPAAPGADWTFTVLPGASHVTATVAYDTAGSGRLHLMGAGGEEAQTGNVRSDPVTIEHPTPGDWMAAWSEGARVGGGQIELTVRYALDDEVAGEEAVQEDAWPSFAMWPEFLDLL